MITDIQVRNLNNIEAKLWYAYLPTDPPTHPGEMLLEEFLKPMGITQKELSKSIHVPYQRINEVINQKRGITPSTALRLAKYFGVSEDFWLNIQLRWDLFKARRKEVTELKRIHPYKPSAQHVAHP